MRTVLYSTLFSAAMPYFEPFWESILEQSDGNFDICFALDGVTPKDITVFSKTHPVQFVVGKNVTPASIRENVLLELCKSYDAIVLVDSDDVLLPNRIKTAKEALKTHDLYACSLELINQEGKALAQTFSSPKVDDWQGFLSHWNIFGFSNTAYRTELLKQLFPIPRDTVMVDWLVAIKALAKGAKLIFDTQPQMLYRQYESNTARVLSPYTKTQLEKSTALLVAHYEYALKDKMIQNDQDFHAKLTLRQKQVEQFSNLASSQLGHYLNELNELKDVFLWWECVAHPDLERLWT